MADFPAIPCGWQGCGKVFEPSRYWQRYCCITHRQRARDEREVAKGNRGPGTYGRGGPRPAKRKVNVRRYEQVKELDARTLEGKTERRTIRELTEHVGGNPTVPQRILIARAARLLVMIELMEKKLIENDEASDWASRQILAWVNALRLLMGALGMGRQEQRPKRLADVLKVKAA